MSDVSINRARALYYAMFSRFFVFNSDASKYYEFIDIIDTLKENPIDSASLEAFDNIRHQMPSDSNVVFVKEFDEIFHSPLSKTIIPTATAYEEVQTGKKRLEMQNFLAKTRIRRDEKKFSEYEDHVGFIFAVMGELCELSAAGEKQYENTIHCIFEQIINDFIERLAKDLYEHEKTDVFKNVAILLKSFIAFERLYLEVSLPAPRIRQEQNDKEEEISEEERERRERNKILRQSGAKEDSSCEVFVASSGEDEL